MSLNPTQIFLYGATATDFQMALGAAAATGVPISQVSGNFVDAWKTIAAGRHLVVAVGGSALYALYYNPCGWNNPMGTPAGHTPFAIANSPADTLPGKDYFVNAAGYIAQDSYLAAVLTAYFALHGHYPSGMEPFPRLLSPAHQCPGRAESNVTVQC